MEKKRKREKEKEKKWKIPGWGAGHVRGRRVNGGMKNKKK